MFLDRRGRHDCFSALVIATTSESQEVFGAAIRGQYQSVEMTPDHATRYRLCQDQPSGKNARNPLLGVVCLLTTGGLIRVGRSTTGLLAGHFVTGNCSAYWTRCGKTGALALPLGLDDGRREVPAQIAGSMKVAPSPQLLTQARGWDTAAILTGRVSPPARAVLAECTLPLFR
jgi:hypothetical protein